MRQTQRVCTSVGIHDAQESGIRLVNARHALIMHVVRIVSPYSSLTVPLQQSGVPDIGDQMSPT
eukprot:4802555-Amphidinium_carterae.1